MFCVAFFGEISAECSCESHEGRQLVNSQYSIGAEQFFDLMFRDGEFVLNFMTQKRKKATILYHYDYQTTPWVKQEEEGEESESVTNTNCTVETRQVSFGVALNQALGPKSCTTVATQCIDIQRCIRDNASATIVIENEAVNQGVPYADSFVVTTKTCILPLTSRTCAVKVHGCVVYKKTVWGLIKAFIEKNTYTGMEEHFRFLEPLLRLEIDRLNDEPGLKESELSRLSENVATVQRQNVVRNKRKSKRRPTNLNLTEEIGSTTANAVLENSGQSSRQDANIGTSLLGIIWVLLALMSLLILSNSLLLYKLYNPVVKESDRQHFHLSETFFRDLIQSISRVENAGFKEKFVDLYKEEKMRNAEESLRESVRKFEKLKRELSGLLATNWSQSRNEEL